MDIETGQVYTIKLNSGEEVVAKIVEANDRWLELEHPVSIAPSPQGMALVPALFTADTKQKITVNINSVSMHCPTDESVRVKYIEATTGLRVPDKKILMS